jgi:hypothetical protein
MIGLEWFVRLKFEPRDLWVGVFWDRKPKNADPRLQYWDIYICLLPAVVIHIFQAIDITKGSDHATR